MFLYKSKGKGKKGKSFIVVFVCRKLRPPDIDRKPFLGLCTTRASRRWPERDRHGWRFPRLPEEPEVSAAQ
jgi:hypothetical protein